MISPDHQIGHYKIRSAIGKGGMGEVFLAEDVRLDRKVALKILPEEFAEDSERMRRFVQEAKATSALNHPNIITLHEIGESDNTHFIVTEYIEGETLRERLKTNPFTVEEAIDVGMQIVSALQAAHSVNIVHRDIKPENIIIRPDGLVKILDFGIAKLTEQKAEFLDAEAATAIQPQTVLGMIIGSANYMSPEQSQGKAVDARSDIFSFGIVLYEMLTGKQPFGGETAMDTIGRILHKEPTTLRNLLPEIPSELERIINKALCKDCEERFQSARDLLVDLKELKEELSFQAKLNRTSQPNKNAETPTQLIKAVTDENNRTTGETRYANSIAVLPFSNMSADAENEYFCDGLAEELLNALAKIDDLKVAARTSSFSFKNKNAEVSEIGKTLHVNTVLEGSVRRAGNRFRITVQLINAANGFHLWSERYDREMQDIFDVQDEITLAVVDALKVKLLGEEKADLLKRYTDNPKAYELYLKGRYHYNKYSPEGWQKGIEYFQEATRKEPQLAPAFAGIAQCQFMLWFFGSLHADEIIPEARAAANRALAIDERLAESHLSLAHIHCYHDWRWEEAEGGYKRAVELSPNSADAHAWYGMLLVSRKRFDKAIAAARRALELDPISLFLNVHVGWLFYFADRLGDVLEQDRKILEIEPRFYGAYWQKGVVHLAREEFDEAIELLRKAIDLGGHQIVLSHLGCAYALAGNRKEALDVLDQLLDVRKQQYAAAFNIARVYAAIGENDKAFKWLEKAIEERNGETILLDRQVRAGAGIWGANFPADSRYQDVLRRIGLPADEVKKGTKDETGESPTAIFTPVKTEEPKKAAAIVTDIEQQLSLDKPKAKRKWWLFGMLALFLLASAFFAYRYFTQTSRQIESIAVLPFENASGNADVEYLSDGMTETLISSLSQLPNLNVKARSSVFRYKGKEIDPQKIASELNVQAILNGRVVQRGDGLILSLELVDAQTENVIWSESYNRKQADLVSLLNEIARDVSNKLRVKLSGADEQKLAKKYTENTEAYQLYLQGRFFVNKRSSQDLQKAIAYFNQAIAVDPSYAIAFAGLADAYALLPIYQDALPREVMPKAREAALKALSLDNNLAEAHAALGYVLVNYDYKFAEGEREYRRAIELNPTYAAARQWLGELLVTQGKSEEGFAEYRRALEIEPFSLPVNWSYGINHYNARRYPEAIAQIKRTLELDNNFQRGRFGLAAAYEASGNYREAAEAFAKLQESRGNNQNAAVIREQFARNGWQGVLRTTVDRLEADNSSPYTLAGFYAQLGEKDKAFAELNKAYENRTFQMILLKVDWRFDSLRNDPRFQELLRRVGFPE